ncbi:MAG: HisA/HisF-related TIM barrel protein [Candidatus Bathyarchaeia archaeon]
MKYYEHIGKPVDAAKRWKSERIRWVHIVDLDAALGTRGQYQRHKQHNSILKDSGSSWWWYKEP